MGDPVWKLLEFEDLKIDAVTLVWNYEVGVQGTLGASASLLSIITSFNVLSQLNQFTYVLHFLGITYPSKPGFTGKLGITLAQDRH